MTVNVHLADVEVAADRLREVLVPTPLVSAPEELLREGSQLLRLKLENLQPVGSFKVRGAVNAVAALTTTQRQNGVYTASAGNMAQGLAYAARLFGIPCAVVVPDTAPRTKIDAARRLGAEVVTAGRQQWWQILVDHRYEPLHGRAFVHPFADRHVIAGQGTIGLELLSQAPDLRRVYASVGGGGLAVGIGLVMRALRPDVQVCGVDVCTAPALSRALSAGKPVPASYEASFIDGMGSPGITDAMWSLVRDNIDGCEVVRPADVARTVTALLRHGRMLAEGAGAAAVTAALQAGCEETSVAVLSGGCLDLSTLIPMLTHETAEAAAS